MNLIRYIQGFGGQSKNFLIRFSLDPGRQTENGFSIVITLIVKMYRASKCELERSNFEHKMILAKSKNILRFYYVLFLYSNRVRHHTTEPYTVQCECSLAVQHNTSLIVSTPARIETPKSGFWGAKIASKLKT